MTQCLRTLGAVAGFHVHAWLESSLNHLSITSEILLQLQKMTRCEVPFSLPLTATLTFVCTCDGGKQSTLSVNFHRRNHPAPPPSNPPSKSAVVTSAPREAEAEAVQQKTRCVTYWLCVVKWAVHVCLFLHLLQKLFETPCRTACQASLPLLLSLSRLQTMTHPRPNPFVLHLKGKVACCTCELTMVLFRSLTQFLLQASSLVHLSVASRTVMTVALLHQESPGVVFYESQLLGLEILDDRSGLNLMNSRLCALFVSKASLSVLIMLNK